MSEPFFLLINPWIYDFAAYDLWIRPFGLLNIAGFLKNRGLGVHLIDCLDMNHPSVLNAPKSERPKRQETGRGHFLKQQIPKPDIFKYINRNFRRYGILPSVLNKELKSIEKPSAVFVTSTMTYWYPGIFDVIKCAKSFFPDVPVLLGGIYATLCEDHARRHSGADYVFPGQCDRRLLRLLSDITGRTFDYKDSNSFLNPDIELLSSKKCIPIATSKGCPLRCSYCASALLSPPYQQRNPMTVVDEMENFITKENTTDFVFYDDALLINAEKHSVPMFREIIRRDLSVRLHAPNGLHVRNIDQKMAGLMMKAGFKTIRLGLESIDPKLEEITGHKVNKDEFIETAAALKSAGFSDKDVGVYVLAGLPGQEFQSTLDTIRFVQDHGFRPFIAEYSPIPGTQLWDQAVSVSPFPIATEPLFHNNTLLPCRWEGFTVEHLDFLKNESRKN